MFVLVVCCGAPVLRMRGALANDRRWYDMKRKIEHIFGVKEQALKLKLRSYFNNKKAQLTQRERATAVHV